MDLNFSLNLAVLSEICARLDHREAAALLYPRLEAHRGRNMVLACTVSLGSAARYQGLLATTLGRCDRAELHFDEARALDSRMGALAWQARPEQDHARLCSLREDPSGAARHAARSQELACRLGISI